MTFYEPRVGLRRMARWRTEDEIRILSAQELLSAPDDDPPIWLIKDILPARGLSVLSSKSEFENRDFALSLARAAARGSRFLGRETQQASVLCWIGRANLPRIKQQVVSLGITRSDPIAFIVAPPPPTMDDVLAELENYILRVEPSLVVVDALPQVADHALPFTSLAEQTGLQILTVDSVATERVPGLLLRWFTMTQEGQVSIEIAPDG